MGRIGVVLAREEKCVSAIFTVLGFLCGWRTQAGALGTCVDCEEIRDAVGTAWLHVNGVSHGGV